MEARRRSAHSFRRRADRLLQPPAARAEPVLVEMLITLGDLGGKAMLVQGLAAGLPVYLGMVEMEAGQGQIQGALAVVVTAAQAVLVLPALGLLPELIRAFPLLPARLVFRLILSQLVAEAVQPEAP